MNTTLIKPAASKLRQSRLPWLLCLWACTAATFHAAADPTVIFSTVRLNGRPFSNVVMMLTPVQVMGQSNSIVLPFSYSNITDTAGQFIISNCVPQAYRVTARYQTGIATWTNCIEAGDGVVYAGYTGALFCGASNSTSFAMNDLRYPSIAGSGITATTNAGRITWSAAGGGSDTNLSNIVFTADNYFTNWTAAVSNLANTKQHGSAVLTNLSGTGALTNAAAFQPANTTLTNLSTNYIVGDWVIGTSELTITNSQWIFGTNVTMSEPISGRDYVFGNSPDTGGRSTNAFLSYADFNRNQFTLGVGNVGSLTLAAGVQLTNAVVHSSAATEVAMIVKNNAGNSNHLLRVLATNGAAALTVTADGKVGVGVTTPTNTLVTSGAATINGQVQSLAGSAGAPSFVAGDLDTGFYAPFTGGMGFVANGVESVRLQANGIVNLLNDSGGFGMGVSTDASIKRHGAGTNAFANNSFVSGTGSILASNLALRGQIEIAQTTATNAAATDTVRLWAANNGGTAELIASDEAGNVVQLTAHPADAPAAFYIVTNWTRSLPRISKTVNLYLGTVEWNNETLAMLLRKWELRGTNIAALPQAVRRALADGLHEEESFSEYNARTGELLVQSDWQALQDQRQASWDAARAEELVRFNTPLTVTNAAGQVVTLPNDTNVTVRAARDVRKPVPARLDERVKQERERKKNK